MKFKYTLTERGIVSVRQKCGGAGDCLLAIGTAGNRKLTGGASPFKRFAQQLQKEKVRIPGLETSGTTAVLPYHS
jgi:hypothetical protein